MIDISTGKEMTRRDFGKGLSAILAAGVAPSIALGALPRGLGARCGMMGGGGGGGIYKYLEWIKFNASYRQFIYIPVSQYTSIEFSIYNETEQDANVLCNTGTQTVKLCWWSGGNNVWIGGICYSLSRYSYTTDETKFIKFNGYSDPINNKINFGCGIWNGNIVNYATFYVKNILIKNETTILYDIVPVKQGDEVLFLNRIDMTEIRNEGGGILTAGPEVK